MIRDNSMQDSIEVYFDDVYQIISSCNEFTVCNRSDLVLNVIHRLSSSQIRHQGEACCRIVARVSAQHSNSNTDGRCGEWPGEDKGTRYECAL